MTEALDALFEGRPEVLTVREVADILRLTEAGAYKWLRSGVVPAYKVGAKWFVLRDELKRTLEAGSNYRPGYHPEPEDEPHLED